MAFDSLAGFTTRVDKFDRQSIPYQLFMLGLCLYAVGALAIETMVRVSPDTSTVLRLHRCRRVRRIFAGFPALLVQGEGIPG